MVKILIIHASAGAGHRKAAEAIYNTLKKDKQCDVVIVDALDYTRPWYKRMYAGSYSFMITRCPWLWGSFFKLMDCTRLLPLIRKIRRIHNSLNAQALERFLKEEQFDYIFSTHFFPIEVVCSLKRRKAISSKVICVITDFDVHSIWLGRGVDFYTVACELTKKKLQHFGVADHQIKVTGIPTDEKFFSPKDIPDLKRKMGIQEDRFTVLIATGSFGIGPIEEMIEVLKDYQILVVGGHNQDLFKRLQQKRNDFLKVYGLVDNMDELMAVSDCMVTKPGGLSIAEALVSGLPLIFFHAIPGQETNNIRILKEFGVGLSDFSIQDMVKEIEQLSSSRDSYKSAVNKVRALAKPQAVQDIISLIKSQ